MIPKMLTIGQKTYPILFNTGSGFLIDTYLRQNGLGTLGPFMDRVLRNEGSLFEIVLVLWGCLEGGRKRAASRFQPFSLDEVNELIDAGGGVDVVCKELIACLTEAQPAVREGETGDGSKKSAPSPRTTHGGTRSTPKPSGSA